MIYVSHDVLGGYSREKAECFGKPHVGARYVGARYERTQDYCAVCGSPATNCHHIVSRGNTLRMRLADGSLKVLRPSMIVLCGSGVTGCHGKAHDRSLRIEWIWDKDEFAERWWNGQLLMELRPHDPRLYAYGFWFVEDRDTHRVREIRRQS